MKNFHKKKSKGIVYYYYCHPETKELHKLPSNKSKAMDITRALNKEWERRKTQEVINLMAVSGPPNISELCFEYIETRLKAKRISQGTIQNHIYCLGSFERQFLDSNASDITTKHLYDFIKDKGAHSRIAYRSLLIDLFRFALSTGFRRDQLGNPAEQLITTQTPTRRKQRHTVEGFRKIYTHAPYWLRHAMAIGLITLQRRSDIVAIKREDVCLKTRTMLVKQQKTTNYSTPVFLEIELEGKLLEIVKECMVSGIACRCPYLIHCPPGRDPVTGKFRNPRQARDKAHPYAVTPDMLTKEFNDIRDKYEVYSHLPYAHRPSFHAIRALGHALMDGQGFSKEEVMAISGHMDERMYERYKAGHGKPEPIRVKAPLFFEFA